MAVINSQYSWHATAVKVPTLGPTRIACIGDSITAGTNSTSALKSAGWRYPLWTTAQAAGKAPLMCGSQAIGDAGFTAPLCFGFPGSTIEGSIATAIPTIATYGTPDIAIFANNGTNNISNGDDAPTTAGKLDTMLTAARAAMPGALFIVCSMVIRNDAKESINVTYNGSIPAICTSHSATFLDLHALLDSSQVQVGGVHPNDTGYQTMATALWGAISPYVNNWVA